MLPREKCLIAAQTAKGRWYAGTTFGLGIKLTSIGGSNAVIADALLLPMLGYYVLRRLQVGVCLENASSVTTLDYQNRYTLYYNNFALYGRYYTRSGLFAELQAGVGRGMERGSRGLANSVFSFDNHKYAIAAGIANAWGRHVSLELIGRYSYLQVQHDDPSVNPYAIDGLSVTAGVSISLDFRAKCKRRNSNTVSP